MELVKYCTSCRKPKPQSAFRKQKNTKDGLQYECRDCIDIRARERYDAKKDTLKAQNAKWQVVNADKHNAAALRHYHSPAGRVGRNMKKALDILFGENRESFLHLVGISVPLLVKHLAKQFKEGQNWENYGTSWRIASIYPLDKHYLSIEEHQRGFCAWENLRPVDKEHPDQIDLV